MTDLARLFERHRAVLEGAANKVLRDPDLSKDAIQGVLENVLSGRSPLPEIPDSERIAWLVGAIRRAAYTLYRRRRRERREQAPAGAAVGVADTRPTWLQEALEREQQAEMDKVRPQMAGALDRLTTGQRCVLEGIFWRGLTLADVAREQGISRQAVSQRYRGAIRRLRIALKTVA